MKHWKNQYTLKILVGLFVLFMAGCPNNLVDKIDEEVAIVVTPPSIVSIYPEANAVSIPVDLDDVLISFTKQIETSSVNSSTFITKDSDGNIVSGTYSVSNDTIAFNPSSNLSYSTVYTITAKSVILDIDGNPMSNEFSWDFTTAEAPAGIKPIIQSFDIEGGNSSTNTENVDLGIFATDHNGVTTGLQFRYKLDGSSDWGNWIDLVDGLGSVSIVLNITSGVTETFSYEAEVHDAVGIVSVINTSQIIYETAAPSPVDVNWDDDSVFPYNGTSLKITFDEEMAPVSFTELDFILEKASDASSVSGMISLNPSDTVSNIIAELWGLELEPNTEYKVVLNPGVTDIAGNLLGGGERIWYFSTGDSTDTTPPNGVVSLVDGVFGSVVTLPSGSIAKGTDNQLRIDLSNITDDYNTVWGMKFWGDNAGAEASFEQDASWESFASTRDWNVSVGDGTKFVLYKFVDSAGNESEMPGQIKIILDNTPPDTPVVTINAGDTHTNATDRTVDLILSSQDTYSGIKEMMLSNNPAFTGGLWEDWSSSVTGWELPDSDGLNIIYVKARDYLDQGSSTGTDSITLDRVNPVVSFNTGHILVNNDVQLFEGSVGGDLYEITEALGIGSYFWEQISGPGIVYFNSVDNDEDSDSGTDIVEPWAWADTEGSYFIQVTVSDSSGNSGSDVVAFSWDETPPGNILNLSVTESNPGYSTSAQPTWTWDTVADADYYRVSFDVGFGSFEDVTSPSYSPNTALSEGTNILYVKALDNAGNESAVSSASIFIDTVMPTIDITTWQYIANVSLPTITINFDGGDGSVSDAGGADASGIDSVLWQKTLGSGTIIFGSATQNTTTVTSSVDDDYQLSFTVTDAAGNITVAYFPILIDTAIPLTPNVSGPSLTPNLRPTWYWNSGGEGIGTYQYRLYNVTDGSTVVDWTSTTTLSYQPGSNLTDAKFYRMDVQEIDVANNWSGIGFYTSEVDTSQTTPAQISIGDAYPSLRTVNTMEWDILSGSGGIADDYRYYYDGSGTWVYGGVGLESVTVTNFDRSGLSDGAHSITIEEYFNSAWQTAKSASHTITVDTVDPGIPNLNGTGYTTLDADRTATNDTTPTWSWTSGGGGNGQYEYSFNGGGTVQTTNTSYTPSAQSDGTYTFSVRERDQAGNWSGSVTHDITVDTVLPIITSVTLRGSTHPDDSDYTYSNDEFIYVDIVGDISAEGSRPVSIRYYDYNPSGWKDWGTNFTGSSETITTTLASTNGTKTVYAELIDEAGNYSGYINDTIILDTTPPSGTFSINNGDTYTPSLFFKMTLNYTDNLTTTADLEVRTYNPYTPVWNNYRTYASTMTSDFQFPASTGSKYTYVTIRDQAGNTTGSIYDSINLQLINMSYATKGSSATSVSVYWTPISGASGTTYYHLYSSTNASANPNVTPSSVESESLSTSGSVITETLASNEKEELRYYWVKTYNATTGGWGPYSPVPVLGFGSNITIIYDSTDSVDTTMANYIKSVLKSNLSSFGTMPSWTVTLMPENMVSSTYSAGNRIYGDPVILTTSTAGLYITPNKVRNIVSMGRGIVAMGYYGLRFIDVASDNWVSWGYPATATTDAYQQPNQIGYGNSYTYTSGKYYMYTWRYGNSVWTSPLSSSSIPVSSSENQVQIGYSNAPANERALVRPLKDNPTRGWLYGRSQDYADRFPVVRQGRFLFYGYDQMWTRSSSGWLYFINLIARMDDY